MWQKQFHILVLLSLEPSPTLHPFLRPSSTPGSFAIVSTLFTIQGSWFCRWAGVTETCTRERFFRKHLDRFTEQKWKILTFAKGKTWRREKIPRKMSLFSKDFTLLCNWVSFTHMQSSFPRNHEEEPGRLQDNYPHPQNPECCTSPTDFCKRPCEETRGITTLTRIPVTALYVNKPWNKKGQFSQVYIGRELSFNQGDIFLIQVSECS